LLFSADFDLAGALFAAGALLVAFDLVATAGFAFLTALFFAAVAFLALAEGFAAVLPVEVDFAVAMVIATVKLLTCIYSLFSNAY
jgi:hypothetical protein